VSDPLERRESPRWVAVKNTAALEFEWGTGVRRVSGRLVNIRREGALITTRLRGCSP
jgi:hypothetical protein